MYTKENFVRSFRQLSSPDQATKDRANHFIIQLLECDEAWSVSRELLQSDNLEQKFFGAQILYNKTEYFFHKLTPEAQQELRAYAYELLCQMCSNPTVSKPAMSKVAATCAIIGCTMMATSWRNFLEDLIQIMKLSLVHLRAGLEILEYVTEEVKNMRSAAYAQKQHLRAEFLKKEALLFQVFNDVFQTSDPESINRNLQCIESWAKFNLDVMKDPHIIPNILKVCLTSEDYFDLAVEIIVSAFIQINLVHYTEASDSIVFKEQLKPQETANLVLIVGFVLSNQDNFYGPQNVKVLSDDKIATKASALSCKIYSFLVQQLLINYPWVILEDLANVGSRLLSIMLLSLRHKNLGVSDTSVVFSYNFYNPVSKLSLNPELQQVILGYYTEACKIVLSRAQRSKLATTVLSVEEGKDDEDTNDEDDNVEHYRINFADYRKGCRQFFATVYQIFYELRGSEGTSTFFKLIDELLKPGSDLPDSNNRLEMALFTVGASIPSMIDSCYETYLQRILEFVCNIDDRYNPNVRVECFRLLGNCSKEISTNKELFRKVVEFQVTSISKGQVGLEAVQSFTSLMEVTKIHEQYKLLDLLLEYYKNSFSAVSNQTVIDKFITGLMKFVMKAHSAQMRQRYLMAVLSTAGSRMQNSFGTPNFLPMRLSEINILFIQLDQIQNSKTMNSQLVDAVVVPFVNSMLEPLRVSLGLCVENKAKLESAETTIWSRSLKTILTMYNIMLDTILRASVSSLNNTFLAVIELSVKLFVQEPACNSHMLHVWSVSLDQHSRRLIQNPSITSWLLVYYPQFNDYFFGMVASFSDPDIFRQFFHLQLAVLNYKQEVFWKYERVDAIYKLALSCLLNINEMYMQKAIMQFLEALVAKAMALKHVFDYRAMLNVVFQVLPQLNAVTFLPFANILILISQAFPDPMQLVMLCVLQETSSFGKLEEPKLSLLARAIDLYIQLRDNKALKSTFIAMYNIATSSSGEVDIWTAIELKVESTSMALKRQQRMNKK